MEENDYFDPICFSIRVISNNVAKSIIIKNHYTHKWTSCSKSYGIFKNKYKDDFFENDEKLVGCIIYGSPVGRSVSESFSSLIKPNEVLELTRMWIEDGHGKNIESWAIKNTFKLIKEEFPFIKLIVSYSDDEVKHKGIIYQASGFYYQGNKSIGLLPNFSISLIGPPYKWIHSRTVYSRYGSHNVDIIKKKIGQTFWRKKESTKHRYFYILANKIDKKKILSTLKHPILPYPKKSECEENVEEVKVDSTKENKFFN